LLSRVRWSIERRTVAMALFLAAGEEYDVLVVDRMLPGSMVWRS
jgi:hypothetical protein